MGRKEVQAKYELRQAEQSLKVTFNLVLENLKSVAESLAMAMEMQGIPINVSYLHKLDKRKSKIPDSHSNYNASAGGRRTPLAVQAFKGVSSKLALSNMTSQISKLNPLMKLKQTAAKKNTDYHEGKLY